MELALAAKYWLEAYPHHHVCRERENDTGDTRSDAPSSKVKKVKNDWWPPIRGRTGIPTQGPDKTGRRPGRGKRVERLGMTPARTVQEKN